MMRSQRLLGQLTSFVLDCNLHRTHPERKIWIIVPEWFWSAEELRKIQTIKMDGLCMLVSALSCWACTPQFLRHFEAWRGYSLQNRSQKPVSIIWYLCKTKSNVEDMGGGNVWVNTHKLKARFKSSRCLWQSFEEVVQRPPSPLPIRCLFPWTVRKKHGFCIYNCFARLISFLV